MKRQFPVFQAMNAEACEFVEFWASQYEYESEHLYEDNISVKPFTDEAIINLFRWKNGTNLSGPKTKSVKQNYIAKKDSESVTQAIQLPNTTADPTAFAREFLHKAFPKGREIWQIFWLHCCNQQFPIYDQHVHRAMVFIEEGRIEELDRSQEPKIDLYLRRYLPFHRLFEAEQRTVDRALHTFGRFIKTWPRFAATQTDEHTQQPESFTVD